MQPMAWGDIIALCSLVVAAVVAVASAVRGVRSDSERDQGVRDRLDAIGRTTTDTQQLLREMDRKLDDHGQRIARLEERQDALDRRVASVEQDVKALRRQDGVM
jgi:uncharacterized protein HemX